MSGHCLSSLPPPCEVCPALLLYILPVFLLCCGNHSFVPIAFAEAWADALHRWLNLTDDKMHVVHSGKAGSLGITSHHAGLA